MSDKRFSFESVEKAVRKKTFCVLTTIDSKGRPHSTGIIYAVGSSDKPFALYGIVAENYAKVRNIKRNPNVSLVVTFPHYWIRFAPASYVMFRGTAEIMPDDDPDGRWAMSQTRIGRMNLQTEAEDVGADLVYIKMTPEPTVFCYGVGIGLMELRSDHENAAYKVTIPEDRR
ncbi:MAG: pyridoxamine 5'-phosphate oxidase family protein [Candidatus Thorarchaeota archaeon]|jgi:general stress protein 26